MGEAPDSGLFLPWIYGPIGCLLLSFVMTPLVSPPQVGPKLLEFVVCTTCAMSHSRMEVPAISSRAIEDAEQNLSSKWGLKPGTCRFGGQGANASRIGESQAWMADISFFHLILQAEKMRFNASPNITFTEPLSCPSDRV